MLPIKKLNIIRIYKYCDGSELIYFKVKCLQITNMQKEQNSLYTDPLSVMISRGSLGKKILPLEHPYPLPRKLSYFKYNDGGKVQIPSGTS